MQTGPSNVVFVAGMGPAGLAAAIGAAQKGYQVFFAEPRLEITRGQRVQIDQNTLNFFESLRDAHNHEDVIFFNLKISRNTETTVELKDIQRYLLRKLDLMSKNSEFPHITLLHGHSVVGIDPFNQNVTLKNESDNKEQKINFAHFVEADGAKHQAADILNKGTDGRFKIEYKDVPYQPRPKESGTIALNVKSGHQLDPRKPRDVKKFEPEQLARLKKYGWNQPYFPKGYVFSNQKNTKLFVSGEIPKSIYDLKDKVKQREALIAWGKVMANILLGYPPEALMLIEKSSKRKPKKTEAKNKIKTTAFPLELKHAELPCIQLDQGGSYVLVGDANKNANFFFSHGVNDAILDAQHFANSLSAPSLLPLFNFRAYHEYQAKQFSKYVARLKTENEPSDMPIVMDNIKKHIEEISHLAKADSSKKFNDRLNKIVQHLSEMGNPDEVESCYDDFEVLAKELKIYLAEKIRHSKTPFCGLFGKNYPKLETDLDDLLDKLQRDFRKYFDLNTKHGSKEDLNQEFRALAASITGSVTIVPSPTSSAANSANPANSSSPRSEISRLPNITNGYLRLIEPIEPIISARVIRTPRMSSSPRS